MRPVDIGSDAMRVLRAQGPGRVRATFTRALYLQVPGGLAILTTLGAPRGPLHIRVAALPGASPGCPVRVSATALHVGDVAYSLDAPIWAPRSPSASALVLAREAARRWLPSREPALRLGTTDAAYWPVDGRVALRRGALLDFASVVGGRGAGLTPAGDDVLAGVLLVARLLRSAPLSMLLRCAHASPTNDVARAFLICAARGRSIEPAHDLLVGLADGDRPAVASGIAELGRFGSSSGAALTYGIRAALVDLPMGRGEVTGGYPVWGPAPEDALDTSVCDRRIVDKHVG